MRKRLLIYSLAFSLGGILTISATEPSVSVVDRQENKSSVPRSEISRINLGTGQVEIVKKNGDKLTFNKETIARILMADQNSGIEEVTESGISVSPRLTEDIVRIDGVTDAVCFYLFDLNGQLCLSGNCLSDGTELSLGAFKKGLYLLVVGEETFKIVKK